MRIKQYFLITNYSLWEVILNGDSPAPTRVVKGVLQPVPLTITEQKLARKDELKARGTLLMALSDKHQLKFNSHKDAKTLTELFPVWYSGSTNHQNTDEDDALDRKEPEFDAKKPESKVIVSPSKFEDFSNNNINEVNAASTLVPTVGQNSLNNTNTFSAAGPSNVAANPTYRKSSCIDASQYPDDLDMPELKDITYSDDDDVGFEDPDHPDKVYKVVKALHGLHQAPRAWYETLTNYLLENGFQRGKIDQTLFIKRQKDGKSASTPIDTEKPLLKDPDVRM
uniref:Putative ribonuclease H-like domain-containing protein n=1 Tax=Tanacetum cinerariifolium TaxID=118510 RepID=A0A699JW36_TANCI|nr:putative ribonuclease H-like domain-containing protein [Tanacetum cinerariifolium]